MKGGSETSQGSMKAEKKQFNTMLKVLRPKVYITDSASFKRLVQELTGNGRQNPTSPSRSPEKDLCENVVPVMEVAEGRSPESYGSGGVLDCGRMTMCFNSVESEIQTLSPLAAFTATQSPWMTNQVSSDVLQQHNVADVWPVEFDVPFASYDGFVFQTGGLEEELFPSECDLSELLDVLNG
ncbi:hypothetical protein H6P81_014105 [Aristolochia fimbriata]|uniref:VQ domain-containing protein n=1 Tax=Aristolochia fimbriata TaxID=158543 RepID=A0AAV7EJV4_ARIFI|nr:hypothetical protein H6P81_014105 [Aristolochia fimbriata]